MAIPLGKHKGSRSAQIAALIMSWVSVKDATNEIHIDTNSCGRKYCRFTTDDVTAILPDGLEANSGWNTQNHYFYEIVNDVGRSIHIQLALSSANMPDDQKETCERIQE